MTTIVPCIQGCGVQIYVYVPGVVNVYEAEAPLLSSGTFQLPSVALASCG